MKQQKQIQKKKKPTLNEQKEIARRRYEILKKKMTAQKDSETLIKYEILSEAYKCGKKFYGHYFTLNKLADDFDLPITTTKRVMALRWASERTWKYIREGKISAFKVAQICSTKNRKFQTELVDAVVQNELTTYDINKLRPEGIDDLNEYRFKTAIEKGYSRSHSALQNFLATITRLNFFYTMEVKHLPPKKIPNLKKHLNKHIKNTKDYLEKL